MVGLICGFCLVGTTLPSYAMSNIVFLPSVVKADKVDVVEVKNEASVEAPETQIKDAEITKEDNAFVDVLDEGDVILENITLNKVQINGKMVNLPVYPTYNPNQYVTMIPFAPIAKELGIKVNYNGDTKTITAADEDTLLTFTIGSETYTIKTGEKQREGIWYDVVPLFIGDKTFVEAGIFRDAFGFVENGNDYEESYVVIDPKIYQEEIKNLKIDNVKKAMAYEKKIVDTKQTINSEMSASFDSKTFGTAINGGAEFDMESAVTTDGFYLDATIKLDGLMNLYPAIFKVALDAPIDLDEPMNFKLLVKDNIAYIKSDIVSEFLAGEYRLSEQEKSNLKGKWIQISEDDVADFIDVITLVTAKEMLTDSKNMEDTFYSSLSGLLNTYYADLSTYDDNMAKIKTLEYFLGDEFVKVTEKGNDLSLTYHLTKQDLIKGIQMYQKSSKIEENLGGKQLTYINQLVNAMNFDLSSTFTYKNHVLETSHMKGTLSLDNIPNDYHINIGNVKVNFQGLGKATSGNVTIPNAPFEKEMVKLSELEKIKMVK